jgi:hypothetical protein
MKVANITAVLSACLAIVAGPSWAADGAARAGSVAGQVAVIRAGQAAPLTSVSTLQKGDRVVVMENGRAQVKFADGCVVQIQANSVTTVGGQSPCEASPLIKSSHPMQSADENNWAAPLMAVLGFAAVYALVVEVNKSDHDVLVAPPLSP